VKFWDASAIVPLLLAQPATESVQPLLRVDGDMVVWWGTIIECASAIARLERDTTIAPPAARTALHALELLRSSWSEVAASEAVRGEAVRLLRVHPLRAADALQLAAALVWSAGKPTGLEVVTLDIRLAAALSREGFAVLP